MSLTINKLKMWKDPGYTRGCLEVPPAGSVKLPATADYALPAGETLRPHKGSILTSLQLPLSYTSLFDMSYLYIEATDGNATVKLYGWIDSITMMASSVENIMLNWSVDWWRSYSGSITWGAGLITRCDSSTYMRPRTLQPRYRTVSSETSLFPTSTNSGLSQQRGQMWVVTIATITVSDNATPPTSVYTKIGYFWWPASYQTLLGGIIKTTDNTVCNTLNIDNCYNGLIDEMITAIIDKIDTADTSHKYNYDIIAAYATPIIPFSDTSWDSNNSYWYSLSKSEHVNMMIGATSFTVGAFYNFDTLTSSGSYEATLSVTPDDNNAYSVVDFDGNTVGSLPWGVGLTGVIVENNIGTSGGYLRVRFKSSILGDSSQAGNLSGLLFTVPLPMIPVTSNCWSDYVLSGQRDYNRRNRELAREEEAWKAGVSETKGAVDKIADLDILGAAVGAATGFSAIGANLIINEQFADKYNALEDMAASRQKNTIQESGFSMSWRKHGLVNSGTKWATNGPWLIDMVMDATSAAEYTGEIATMGYQTQIPAADVSAFITAAGPLQIKNLTLTGSVPPQAKQAIKTRLENGVRIIENNPSGVAP